MNHWILTSKLGLLAFILFLSSEGDLAPDPHSVATPPCVSYETGDLIDEIGSIIAVMPGPDSNGMLVPTAAQMAGWETLLDAVQDGDLAAACDTIAAHAFPYKIVYYTDTGYTGAGYHGGEYLILEENMPTSVGWGTYVLADEAESNLVFEVPHPGCEWHTENEGVQMLRQTQARALLIAGTHRCANTTYSACSGTTSFCGVEEPHRTSDVAHATETIFFTSHRVLVEPGSDAIAVQLHGCADAACPDLFISNGTCEPGELALEFYRQALSACGPLTVDIADCVAPECSFVGTTNVEGRYSNTFATQPAFDACTQNATGPSDPEQFFHLEQSRALRDNAGCLAIALRRTFGDLHERYLPAVANRRPWARGTGARAWDMTWKR